MTSAPSLPAFTLRGKASAPSGNAFSPIVQTSIPPRATSSPRRASFARAVPTFSPVFAASALSGMSPSPAFWTFARTVPAFAWHGRASPPLVPGPLPPALPRERGPRTPGAVTGLVIQFSKNLFRPVTGLLRPSDHLTGSTETLYPNRQFLHSPCRGIRMDLRLWQRGWWWLEHGAAL